MVFMIHYSSTRSHGHHQISYLQDVNLEPPPDYNQFSAHDERTVSATSYTLMNGVQVRLIIINAGGFNHDSVCL